MVCEGFELEPNVIVVFVRNQPAHFKLQNGRLILAFSSQQQCWLAS
jgi:hypothetical protein